MVNGFRLSLVESIIHLRQPLYLIQQMIDRPPLLISWYCAHFYVFMHHPGIEAVRYCSLISGDKENRRIRLA